MNNQTVKALIVMILSVTLLGACQNNQKNQENNVETTAKESVVSTEKEIPFIVAEKYFVNNTVKNIDNPKIETKEEFDKLFGMAAVMGENGLPTEIDFTKQYVIAVVKPETDQNTHLTPVSLQLNEKKEIVFSYRIEVGEKQTYRVRPCLIIIVDEEASGNVILQEIN